MDLIQKLGVDLLHSIGIKDCNLITQNLYIGNYKSSTRNEIEKAKFDVVINCSPNLPFHSSKTYNYRISVKDDLSNNSNLLLLDHIKYILPIIHYHLISNHKILIHCRAGMQRSCAVTAAYLMKYNHINQKKATSFIQKQRPIAFMSGSNFNFCLGLLENNLRRGYITL
tara:strand:+ start:2454 stop:2960 length:507 start_codon:yes stop_codon:yes gene_type:complete